MEAIRTADTRPETPSDESGGSLVAVDWRRLFGYVRPYWRRLSVAIVCLFLSSAIGLMVPLVAGLLVDAISGASTPGRSTVFEAVYNFYTEVLKRNPPQFRGGVLNWVALLMLGVFVVQSVFNFLQGYLLAFVGERIVADLRVQVFKHLQALSLGYFSERRVGEITSRVTSDVTVIQQTTTVNIASFLQNLITFIGGITLMLFLSYRLTILTLLVVPMMLVAGIIFGRRIRNISTEVQDRLADATAVLEESIAGVRVVQSFARERYEVGRFREAIEDAFHTSMRRARVRSIFLPIISFLGFSALVLVLWYGGQQVVARQISSGDLVSFLFYAATIAASLGTFTGLYAQLQEAIGATHRVFGILDTMPDIRDKPDAVPLPMVSGDVVFTDVSFAYGGDKDGPVLHDVTFQVKAGEIVALVGPSGAGKTTIVNMIPRFYDPNAGGITIDGHDVRDVRVRSLREQIGIVPQDTLLFSGSIRDNLSYGKLNATDDEITAAARAANADTFIRRMPEGYNTLVGDRGLKLSGGQRQRIAIARALLKDPRILILDEATSALDSESEGLVQEALERLMQDRTTFIIAHRLSTVKIAHQIIVLEHGRIVQQGSHDELMVLGGLYQRLYNMQFKRDVPELAASSDDTVGSS